MNYFELETWDDDLVCNDITWKLADAIGVVLKSAQDNRFHKHYYNKHFYLNNNYSESITIAFDESSPLPTFDGIRFIYQLDNVTGKGHYFDGMMSVTKKRVSQIRQVNEVFLKMLFFLGMDMNREDLYQKPSSHNLTEWNFQRREFWKQYPIEYVPDGVELE